MEPNPASSVKPAAPTTPLAQLIAATCLAPGWQSSELYLALGAIVLIVGLLCAGKIDQTCATALLGAVFTSYPAARSWLKARHLDAVAGLLAANGRADMARAALLAIEDTTSPAAAVTSEPLAPQSPPDSGAGVGPKGGFALMQMLGCIATAFIVALIVVTFSGCGTPFGIGLADALQSQANQAIIAAGVQGGMLALESSYGSKIPPSMQQPLETVSASVVDGVAWSGVYAVGQALRTKQGTDKSAAPGALTAAIMNQAGTPQANATVIAQQVSALAGKGIAPDKANEAIAATLDAVAAAKAPGSKSIVLLAK